jgi:two-component sensor histidine kinase/CheY-like chemotaxis protein
LALVQSIVRLTRSEDIKSYIAAVDGRIGALARAHTLLAQSRWQGADLARLLAEELAPFRTDGAERIKTAGPEVSLEPRTAQTLALALHELSTNAAKYGALSVISGRVAVSWELQPQGLVLRWSEGGGPPPRPPAAPGFGIRLISASIERQLGGEAAFDWRSEGLHCVLRVPCRDYIDALANRAGTQRRIGEDRPELPLRLEAGNRVLLVEDEILVAMMMKDILTELGFSVIGPFSRLSEAMVAAVHEDINAGIIDVNLGGEFVYPVADVLAARKIPFVFVTGYGVESIDSRFGYVPIVKKPVQRQVLQKIFVPPEAAEPAKLPKRRYAAERVTRAASAGQP